MEKELLNGEKRFGDLETPAYQRKEKKEDLGKLMDKLVPQRIPRIEKVDFETLERIMDADFSRWD